MQSGKIIEIKGDGEFVSIEVETEYGERILIKQPKLVARQIWLSQIRNAAYVREKDCTDSIDHWEGHCGCK